MLTGAGTFTIQPLDPSMTFNVIQAVQRMRFVIVDFVGAKMAQMQCKQIVPLKTKIHQAFSISRYGGCWTSLKDFLSKSNRPKWEARNLDNFRSTGRRCQHNPSVCQNIDMNLICQDGQCICRPGMDWNNATKECQVVMVNKLPLNWIWSKSNYLSGMFLLDYNGQYTETLQQKSSRL